MTPYSEKRCFGHQKVKMHDKNYYLKLLAKYRALNNADGIRATLEVLKMFDEKQASMEEFVK